MSQTDGSGRPLFCNGVRARFTSHDARWFAIMSFTLFGIGAIGMVRSSISCFGWSFDIGQTLGMGSFILTESMLMIVVFLLVSMFFFAGGLHWYVLCRHCPCYEYSGKEHGNEGRFYCLANWNSPKLFKYKPGKISRGGQLVFIVGSGFFFVAPVLYLWDRIELALIQIIMSIVFFYTLRSRYCNICPNFGCILNSVPEEKRVKFLKALEAGEIY